MGSHYDFRTLCDNHKGKTMYQGGYVHHGLLQASPASVLTYPPIFDGEASHDSRQKMDYTYRFAHAYSKSL